MGHSDGSRALGVALVLSAWMVLEDQFRLQPWMYQFLLMGLALAACPQRQAIGLCRFFVIAMYFHSGLSKLDKSFVEEQGYSFFQTAMAPFVGPARWPQAVWRGAVLAMPAWEIAAAVGLIFRPTRPFAMVGAIVLHLALIAILGPWSLSHSTNVLVWNASMLVEVLLLFALWPIAEGPTEPERAPIPPLASACRLLFVFAAILPFGERWGLWDTWPSFALYASHNERIWYVIPKGELDRYPAPLRPRFERRTFENHLDLNSWSLAERGTPIYPQGRALNGVAEALASRYGDDQSPGVVLFSRAQSRWSSRRTTRPLVGYAAIRRHGDTYWLNAHPAP